MPELDRRELLDLYDAMVLTRETEERLEILVRQGHILGGLYRSLGQEAGPVGAAYALRRHPDGTGDLLAPTVRAVGALFLFGGTPLELFRQYMARRPGPTGGREANVHFTDLQRGFIGPVSPLGVSVAILAGMTLTFRMRGEDRVGLAFTGDGATSTGAWHEGLGMAAANRCPLILMVVDNRWAFSTPTRSQTRVASFTEKAAAYGITAESVDGNDVVAVYRTVRSAAERARAGGGVQLIESRTYRRLGHAQHDPQEYVDPDELREWEARDPLDRFVVRLTSTGVAEAEELSLRRERIRKEVGRAAEEAVVDPAPAGEEALAPVFTDAETPDHWTRRGSVRPGRAGAAS